MEISVFLPTRKGSERVRNKNTRQFAQYEFGLLELKIKQLMRVQKVSEIILSTDDIFSLEFVNKLSKKDSRIKTFIRPENLALSSTSLSDLVQYVPSVCESEVILWTHVTSPFFEAEDYDRAIEIYLKRLTEGYDSLMTVKKIQNFLWSLDRNDIVNRKGGEKWPRTQDLTPLYEIDSALFITSRRIYIEKNDRIGQKPFLFEQEGLKSFDVDWQEDFILAEKLYKSINE